MRAEQLIVGGGPAGSAMAIHLANAGYSPVLLEKTRAPHDKMCGEFISIEAQRELAALGLDLSGLGAVPIRRLRAVTARHTAEAALPFEGLSLSRRLLDEALLEKAADRGVRIRRGAHVSQLTFEAGAGRVRLADGAEFGAGNVFLCTGKHALRGWPRRTASATDPLGFKMHYRLGAAASRGLREHTELYLFPGGYAGLEPIEEGKANLCLVANPARFAESGRSWAGLIAAITGRLPLLGERLAGAAPCWAAPLAIAAIPYGYLRKPENATAPLYPLGDQMAVIPSFCGDGLAMALHTAALALPFALAGDPAGYGRAAYAELHPQMRRAGWLAAIMARPLGQNLLAQLLDILPQSLAPLVWQTRIAGSAARAA